MSDRLLVIITLSMLCYNTVKPVYKGHSRDPENVPCMSNFPLYTD